MDPRLPEPPGSPRLLRARGVGEILVDAFEIYRRHWQNLIAIVAVVVVPLTILQVVLVDAFIDDVQVEELPDGTVQVTGDLGSAVAGGIVVAVVFTLAFMVLTGAMTRAAAGTFLARDLTIAETYRYGFARLGSIRRRTRRPRGDRRLHSAHHPGLHRAHAAVGVDARGRHRGPAGA